MIFLVHHLLLFFKSTLTVPKIKDLVNAPQKKYEDIYNILSKDSSALASASASASSYGGIGVGINSNDGTTNINDINTNQEVKIEINSMKNELKSFLKKQLKGNGDRINVGDKRDNSEIATLDSFNSNNFSLY